MGDDDARVLTVNYRDGLYSAVLGAALIYWLVSQTLTFLTDVLGRWSTIPSLVLYALVGLAFSIWYASYSVQVGRDGVYVGRWRSRRFVPATDIVAVHERRSSKGKIEGLDVLLRNKPAVMLALRQSAHVERLRTRIEQLIAESQGGGLDRLAQLARSGRSLEAWKKDLALLASGSGFRAAGASFEDLDRVLHDPAATPEHRIAAALALKSRAEPHGSQRIRVAAEATAHPKVRVALTELAEGRDADDAVEEALAEADAQPAQTPTRS